MLMGRKRYPKPFDVLGREIKLGDTIVYPVRRRAQMVLRVAVVSATPGQECDIKKGIVALSHPMGRRVIIENPKRCAIIQRFEED